MDFAELFAWRWVETARRRRMKVLQENVGAVTNFELVELLRRQARERSELEGSLPLPGARRASAATSAATWQAQQEVAEQILAYLEGTPCALQNRESIVAFMAAVHRFKLTQAEVVSLINAQPCSRVEIHLIVEECEERLSEEQVGELLQLCSELSPEQAAE